MDLIKGIRDDFNKFSSPNDTYIVCDFGGAKVYSYSIDILRAVARSLGINDVEGFLLNANWISNQDSQWLTETGTCAVRLTQVVKRSLHDRSEQTMIIADNVNDLKKVTKPICDYLDMLKAVHCSRLPRRLLEDALLARKAELKVDASIDGVQLFNPIRIETGLALNKSYSLVDAIISTLYTRAKVDGEEKEC